MCLRIKSGPHIATKNFYTLKIVRSLYVSETKTHGYSFYQGAMQEFDVKYKAKIVKNRWDNEIYEGLHSIYKKVNDKSKSFFNGYYNLIDKDASIVLCKIPKGSKFYIGNRDDIVSNNLILLETIITNDNFLDKEIDNMPLHKALGKAFDIMKTYPNYEMTPQFKNK